MVIEYRMHSTGPADSKTFIVTVPHRDIVDTWPIYNGILYSYKNGSRTREMVRNSCAESSWEVCW